MAINPSRQKKLNKRSRRFFNESQFGWKLLIVSTLIFCLACFLHFRDFRLQVLEINRTAQGYVVAQVDFEFPDPDATLVLRQEALRDIGRIYRINEKEIRRVRHKFENYLIHHPNWRQDHDSTFEAMYQALDAVTNALSVANLTDSRTLKKREEIGLDVREYYVIPNLDTNRLNTLTDSFWRHLRTNILAKTDIEETTIQYVIDYFKGSRWKVTNDIDSQRAFQQLIQEEIPEKYTRVRAGSRIIDRGEKATNRHLAMIQAMKKEIRESQNIWNPQSIFASLIFSLIIIITMGVYFYFRQNHLLHSVQQLALYTTIFVLTLVFGKIAEVMLLYGSGHWIDYVRFPVIVPFATILYCILLNEEIAFISTFILTIVTGLTMAFPDSTIIFINMVTGALAVVISRNLKKTE